MRRRRVENLPQFRLLQSRPVQLRKPLSELPKAASMFTLKYREMWRFKVYLSWSTAGSEKRDGKSTTSHGLTSCGRCDSLPLATRRAQVHPHRCSRRVGGDLRGLRLRLPPSPWITFVGPFLSDIPLPASFDQTITFHRVLNNEKGGFSFSAAGGPTPRDDSARSDRKENALPGCEVPPLSPPHNTGKTGRRGGVNPSG